MTVEQRRPIAVSEAFMRDVLGRMWKGNTRELRSYLEQALVLGDEGVLDLLPHFSSNNELDLDAGEFVPFQAMIEETERAHIRRARGRTSGSVSKTAQLLGISRRTLWEEMKRPRMNTAGADVS
jgi:transcriptional regulator of acetoin/glycerol metabolism